jgi:transposase
VVVFGAHAGAEISSLSSKVEKSHRLVKKWLTQFKQNGIASLRDCERKPLSPERLAEINTKRDRIIEILHESPRIHGINRSSWSLTTLANTYECQYGKSIGKSTISEYIKAEGYSFRKARRVLTSPDPKYREKLKAITRILSALQANEKFFSVDEFGPFSVKIQGGRTYVQKGDMRVVPQRQRSKGRLILTGALELSTNQMTHFYSEKKDTEEMIKLLDILLSKYSDQARIYISWDAASWHISRMLTERVSEINAANKRGNLIRPMVKLAPLPVSAQFLNIVESVFSGMARAILHNSDYASVSECKRAIETYFIERNQFYKENPRRAGNKIWGGEIVEPYFSPTNNCKDRNWR